jgi:hypothetical protein
VCSVTCCWTYETLLAADLAHDDHPVALAVRQLYAQVHALVMEGVRALVRIRFVTLQSVKLIF